VPFTGNNLTLIFPARLWDAASENPRRKLKSREKRWEKTDHDPREDLLCFFCGFDGAGSECIGGDLHRRFDKGSLRALDYRL
jgi:hypothetical protein